MFIKYFKNDKLKSPKTKKYKLLKLTTMKNSKADTSKNELHGFGTRAWSTLCHNCGICKFANKKPKSSFNKIMVWHRTWCPGWASHTKVYGVKSLS